MSPDVFNILDTPSDGGGDPQEGRTMSAIALGTPDATYSDGFAAAELDVAWTARNNTPTFPYTQPGMRVSFDAQGDGIWRPAPAASEYEVVVELDYLGGNTQSSAQVQGIIGIGILQSDGTGVGCSLISADPPNLYVHTVTTYNYAVAQHAVATSGSKVSKIALALHKNGTDYRVRYSNDGGANWSAYSTAYSSAHTAAQIGFGRFFTAGTNTDAIMTLRNFGVFTPSFGA